MVKGGRGRYIYVVSGQVRWMGVNAVKGGEVGGCRRGPMRDPSGFGIV